MHNIVVQYDCFSYAVLKHNLRFLLISQLWNIYFESPCNKIFYCRNILKFEQVWRNILCCMKHVGHTSCCCMEHFNEIAFVAWHISLVVLNMLYNHVAWKCCIVWEGLNYSLSLPHNIYLRVCLALHSALTIPY